MTQSYLPLGASGWHRHPGDQHQVVTSERGYCGPGTGTVRHHHLREHQAREGGDHYG